MAFFFSKRLTCFYCGCRSPKPTSDPILKWQCKHCDAVNYLDEKGEITDPPASETNPDVYGPGASSPPFEAADFKASGLFCSECIRNQHLFTTMLASYFPSPDDPTYSEHEQRYPEFRRRLEERYPQVCANCEPRVMERIRQTGYEAKADNLRRMMDRSKAGRAASRARKRNWRSWLVFVGAIAYWGSIAGQLAWDLMGALDAAEPLQDPDDSLQDLSLSSCISHALQTRRVPSRCSTDLAPLAGLSLLAGLFSLWWNPKLRMKVEGRPGRFVGLGDYYKVQLIVIVARCVFWAVLRDPSSSGLQENLPPTLHVFMILFIILAVIISRWVVKYDTRPLVSWTEHASAATPSRRLGASASPTTVTKQLSTLRGDKQTTPRFPLEKLATPKREPEKAPANPALPAEVDDMDWTPSVQRTHSVHHELRPNVSIYQKNERSVLDGPLPFYGSLPAAPQPPSWRLFNRPSQKPIEQVVEPNPFHRARTADSSWQQSPDPHEPVFAPPKFFPPTDHADSTGLESLFDQTFTIRSPEDEPGESRQQERPQQTSYRSNDVQGYLLYQYLRLGLLLASVAAWLLAQNGHIAVPGNYIEVISLGSASLIAGFGLLEVLKQPMVQWNGVEILVYIAELVAAVHLGYNLPRVSLEKEYFNRYGKLLLIFMAVQEALGLVFFYQTASANIPSHNHQAQQPTQPTQHGNDEKTLSSSVRPKSRSPSGSSQPSVPALSFSSTAPTSSFSTQPPEPQYQPGFAQPNQGSNENHSFSLKSLKEADSDYSDGLDHDSDTETTMTTATTATNNTIRNIRYGRNFASKDALFSPNRTELGPGIGGLSLDDKPVRMTRSQTQKLRGIGARGYPLGRAK